MPERWIWCEPPADGEQHGFVSRDGGATWQRDGEYMDGRLGDPVAITGPDCPVCGSPLHRDTDKEN